jgi:4-amino-4-deoxy-L-arabinose transferase-like glycosyltransferase
LRSDQRLLIPILLVSVISRVGMALYLGDHAVPTPAAYDQVFFHDVGLNLLSGDGFSFSTPPWGFIEPNRPSAFISFAYGLFIAGVYAAFGPHPLLARVVQALLCSLTPWLVYRLARRMLASPPTVAGGMTMVPIIAAAVSAVYTYFVYYSATLMTEGLYLLAVAWALVLTVDLSIQPSMARWALWGLAVGLASLLRQVFMPIALLLFAYAVWRTWPDRQRRVRPAHVLAALAVGTALILPWTVRNYLVFHRFLLLNSQAGLALWNANHPDLGTHFEAAAMFPIPDDLRGLNEVDLTNELMRRGVQEILADPRRFLLLSLDRLRIWLIFWPMRESSLFSNIARPLSFGISLPFIIVGLVRSAREWRRWLLLYLFIGLYTFIHVISWVQIRYRMPVDLALVPFTALGICTCWGWLQRLRARRPGGHSTPA